MSHDFSCVISIRTVRSFFYKSSIQMAIFVDCSSESMKDRILDINGGIILGRPYNPGPRMRFSWL